MCTIKMNFYSEVLKGDTNVNVILPTLDYSKAPFKTVYLLHGGDGSADDWLNCSSAAETAIDNGIALVLPEVGGESFYCDMNEGPDYFTYISEELVSKMEQMFPLSNKKEDRFVAGLSMGGY